MSAATSGLLRSLTRGVYEAPCRHHLRSLSTTLPTPAKKKKSKAEVILVMCESLVSGNKRMMRKARLGDKLQFLAFDPSVQREVIYRETEKIKSIREDPDEWYSKPSELKLPASSSEEKSKSA